MSTLIEVKDVSYHYPYQDFVLDKLNLTVSEGCILGVLGRNGSGKTTLMNLLLGVKQPVMGKVTVLGKDPFREKSFLNDVGFCSHDVILAGNMRVIDHIRFYHGCYSFFSEGLLEKYLSYFSVDKNQRIGSLSTGERAKIQIVSSLSRDPKLLLVDEITAVLDVENRYLFFEEIKRLVGQNKMTVVIATNIVEDLEGLADRTLFIDETRVIVEKNSGLKSLFIKGQK